MTAENKTEHFDLITFGQGYLNPAQIAIPIQGPLYERVGITALYGNSKNPSYSYFDCRVVGADAIDFVKTHRDAINDRNTKVLVKFYVGDGVGEHYILTKGKRKGVLRDVIKGDLLKITWAKIGDVVVLDMRKDDAEAEDVDGGSDAVASSDTQAAVTTDSSGA
jgi:hypothetical protein